MTRTTAANKVLMAAPSRYSGADFIEHLAEPLHEPEGDEGAPQTEEGLVHVRPTLVAYRQSAESMQPRECPLHHPAVATELVLRFNAASCGPRDDAPVSAGSPTTREVVALIGMEFRRPVTRRTAPAAHRPNAVEQVFEPFGKSMAEAAWSSSSRTWCSLRQTPASFQSRSRRHQVMPLPQPISCESISQGMPLLRTKRMPVKAARSGTGGRPPLGLRRRLGSSDAIRTHSLSPTNAAATPPVYNDAILRPGSGECFVRRS